MKRADVARAMRQLAVDAAFLAREFPSAWESARQLTAGYPRSALSGGSSGSEHGDPTAGLVLRPDALTRRLRGAEDDLVQLAALLERLVLWVHEQRPAKLVNEEGVPGCTSCARLDRWEPIHRTRQIGDKRVALCRWCYDFEVRWDVLPPRKILERHHDGHKISETMVRQHLPLGKVG